jgi:3-isopropylmalate dehydrogenase
MLLRWSLGEDDAAQAIENAVAATISEGQRTPDMASAEQAPISTAAFGNAVARRVAGD